MSENFTFIKTIARDDYKNINHIIHVDVLYLHDLPKIMREKMGWTVAPQLMEHWFQGEAYAFNEVTKKMHLDCKAINIPSQRVNNTIVTMQWARRYKQVIEKIDLLSRKWATEAGINLLKKRLREGGLNLGMEASAMQLDTYSQVNMKSIGGLFDTINDYYGALGNCNLKIAIKGHRGLHHGRQVFFVEQQGFYIKDTYDFVNDGEFLGLWSKTRGVAGKASSLAWYINLLKTGNGIDFSVSTLPQYPDLSDYVPVYNEDFSKWRNKYHKGGDFIVFSDVFWQAPPPDSLTIIEL
ncbi:DUF6402 family protein [Neisseriaceae bacterium ESL0693]|nr:DUF6402 family protein [Neisseriaceae bacterium ESL0693]